MQLETLKLFCDLVETRSYTKAAQLNDVTQSAICQVRNAVEREFRARLVERGRHDFDLTAEGEEVYACSKGILQEFDDLQRKLQAVRRNREGNIHIVSDQSIALYDLPPCLRRFRETQPEVNVQVACRDTNQVYEDILRNSADLGLVAFPSPRSGIRTLLFRKDPFVLACHPQHPLAALKVVKLRELRGLKMVGFESHVPANTVFNQMIKSQSRVLKQVAQFDNIESVKRAVELDLGVAILPERTIRAEVENGSLASMALEGGYFAPLAIVHRTVKVLTPAMRRFVELLREPL